MNIDLIVEKYCENTDRPELNCDGKCYLAKTLQLQQAQSHSKAVDQAKSLLVEAFYPLYFKDYNDYVSEIQIEVHPLNDTAYFFSLKTSLDSIIKPPPQILST